MTEHITVSRELLRQALDALEFFASEMTVGQRYTNEGQTAIDAPRQLRTALEQPAVEPTPVYAFRRKGLDDFCTCSKERFDELSNKSHLFETTTFYTAPPRTAASTGACGQICARASCSRAE